MQLKELPFDKQERALASCGRSLRRWGPFGSVGLLGVVPFLVDHRAELGHPPNSTNNAASQVPRPAR
jgi:hypothetical protein